MPDVYKIDRDTFKALSPAEQMIGEALLKLGRWQLIDEKKAGAKV